MQPSTFLSALLFTVSVAAKLSKPPLHENLDYLEAGLKAHLQSPPYQVTEWNPGWIAEDCKSIAENENLNPADVKTYSVKYDDCSAPWILCRHKDSPSPVGNLFDRMGRLPVGTRQFVRHVIALPDPNSGHAYNANGNVAMFNIVDSVSVFIHEAGHSLDFQQAFVDTPLSTSANWINNYNQDSAVPDPYAQTNQAENVAQNIVVSTFNENVPGKFIGVEPNAAKIFHQYATVITEARNAGNLITAGGTCTRRLANSGAVYIGGRRMKKRGTAPDTSLGDDIEVLAPQTYHSGSDCGISW